MKKLYLALTIGALALVSVANANTIPITNNGDGTDDSFQDITGGSPVDIVLLEYLKGEILSYENHVGPLPPLTENLTKYEELGGVAPSIDVVAGDYLVVHYGAGPKGAPGGGLVVLLVTENQKLDIPANGGGPNGFGGISFVRVYDHVVPDGGVSIMLLGTALAALGLIRRKIGC